METSIVQGRPIGVAEVEQIRQLLASHPDWSRRRLSEELAILWNWRNGAGRLKDMAARALLLKLEQRGWIGLPPRRRTAFNRMRHKQVPALDLATPQPLLSGPLPALLPLLVRECSHGDKIQRPLFDALLHWHHYLVSGRKLTNLAGGLACTVEIIKY